MKKDEISKLQEEQSAKVVERIRCINGEIDTLKLQEEMMWHPRSKQNWITTGDINTSFFHQKASLKERRNKIHSIQSEDGRSIHDDEGIEATFIDYFQRLFKSNSPHNFDVVLYMMQ